MFKNPFSKRPEQPVRDMALLSTGKSKAAAHLVATETDSRSYFGGLPQLPAGVSWPTRGDRALSLLAVIDLAELAGAHRIDWLPDSGSLLFFYDVIDQPWGFNPDDKGSWTVVHVPAGVAVVEHAAPDSLDEDGRFSKISIAFRAIASYPSVEHALMTDAALTDREFEKYGEFKSAVFDDKPHHQMDGFPDPIQGDGMEEECQLASNGLYCGDGSGYSDPRAVALAETAHEWRLLLQIDSDDHWMWGDCGMLYFWIREADARAGQFDRAWLVLQCG